ncbi:MAG: RnfABCDGE type electron transport complex subunit D [Flavobacteriales bacterium]
MKSILPASWLQDGRNYQIVFLGTFLMYGIWALGWEAEIEKFGVLLGTCMITQLIAAKIFGLPVTSVKSAIITSLGMCILLQVNSLQTAAIAGFIAISSKFIFRINKKHFFNPANFGIIVCMLVTGDCWISPGQWGSSGVLVFMVGALGAAVLFRVSRLDISFFFLGTLFLLDYSRMIVYQGWDWDFLWHKYSNGSLLLFTFFMITDPVSTPSHPIARKIWAMGVAGLTFYLASFMQVHTAPVWALFIISPATVIFDYLLKAKKFEWLPSVRNSTITSNTKTL